MAGFVSADISHHGASDGGSGRNSKEEKEESMGRWYMSRKEIEENSPSRRDGIDLKKETYLRKSYCTFLQDLGIRLKVPQVTIATAIIFCHRFFLRQSHAKNDRRTIATVCMFLAGKVEETPRPLKDVILVSYEIIHKKDLAAAQRIKQKEVYEQQKELILLGERAVLATLGFDFNVQHPYKPLVEAIKKFNVAKNVLAQVAWNFVNDGLRTSLCLQFKPHHIAAGATFLAAKFLKVKLPSDGERVWWQEFDVTPRQLEEVSNQMLELYEQNSVPPSQGSEVDRTATKVAAMNEEQALKQISSRPAPQHPSAENHNEAQGGTENQSNDVSADTGSVITDHKVNTDTRDSQNSEQLPEKDNNRELTKNSDFRTKQPVAGSQGRRDGRREAANVEKRDVLASNKSSCIVGQNLDFWEGPLGQSPKEATKKMDKNKVKAALEKRKKVRGKMTLKEDVMDEDDLIEKELEDGVKLALEDEKNKYENGQNGSKTGNADHGTNHKESRDGKQMAMKGKSINENEAENAVGEMVDNASPSVHNRKSKAGSSPDRQRKMKMWLNTSQHTNQPGDGS